MLIIHICLSFYLIIISAAQPNETHIAYDALGNQGAAREPICNEKMRACGSQAHLFVDRYFMVGMENSTPSRTPEDGQRWVTVLRRV